VICDLDLNYVFCDGEYNYTSESQSILLVPRCDKKAYEVKSNQNSKSVNAIVTII